MFWDLIKKAPGRGEPQTLDAEIHADAKRIDGAAENVNHGCRVTPACSPFRRALVQMRVTTDRRGE